MPAMHPLEVAAFDFCFRARGPMRMTGYMGSAWRGGFGQALRHAACVTGLPDRQLEESCVYPYLFETAPDTEGGILAGCDRVPNPFVLAPSWNESHLGREGGETGLRLVLIGALSSTPVSPGRRWSRRGSVDSVPTAPRSTSSRSIRSRCHRPRPAGSGLRSRS